MIKVQVTCTSVKKDRRHQPSATYTLCKPHTNIKTELRRWKQNCLVWLNLLPSRNERQLSFRFAPKNLTVLYSCLYGLYLKAFVVSSEREINSLLTVELCLLILYIYIFTLVCDNILVIITFFFFSNFLLK